MPVSNDVILQIIGLARSARTRTSTFSKVRPTHWAPTECRCPVQGEPFTPDGAWQFVVQQLEEGCAIEEIVLEKPPGKKGYVLIVKGWGGEEIYIKLQLGSGMVIGRSFHLSRR